MTIKFIVNKLEDVARKPYAPVRPEGKRFILDTEGLWPKSV